jgi:hypothetical protein
MDCMTGRHTRYKQGPLRQLQVSPSSGTFSLSECAYGCMMRPKRLILYVDCSLIVGTRKEKTRGGGGGVADGHAAELAT